MSLIKIGARIRHGGRRCARRWLGSFVRRKEGSAAVEFALVAAPFMALLFAIIETAIVFFAGQAMETAVADASRLILTGQAQTQSFDQAAFKNAVCARVYAMFDCAGGMYVDVRTYTNFSADNSKAPVDANGNLINDFQYQPGGPGDVVVVRAMYQWPVYVTLLGFNLADRAGSGHRLLMATTTFRNEPYK